jgi:antitoxin component YwqK of YwqJK toxin-antitoxin module
MKTDAASRYCHLLVAVAFPLLLCAGQEQDKSPEAPKLRMVSEDKFEVKARKLHVIGEEKPYTGIKTGNPYLDGGGEAHFNIVDGLHEGPQRLWHANGALAIEYHCVHGKTHGFYRTWWPNGNLEREETYVNGEMTGPVRSWYDNGQLKSVMTVKNEIPVGYFVDFHENGRAALSGSFRDGKHDGLWVEWDTDGKEISRKYHSAALGKEVTEKEWLARKD